MRKTRRKRWMSKERIEEGAKNEGDRKKAK
jgi:hypothetical protein